MLPRSVEALNKAVDDFSVALDHEQIVGCGSLYRLGEKLVEIRSFGVLQSHIGYGIGRKLLNFLIDEAKQRQIPQVMALTYEVSFFEKNGFQVVSKEIFPEKVWTDCIFCPKRDRCDEIAVLKKLD